MIGASELCWELLSSKSSLQSKFCIVIIFIMNKQNKRVRLVVLLELIIAAIFIIGAEWISRSIYILFQSYYADIFLPFGFYFLLSAKGDRNRYLNSWWKKSIAIFALCASSETLQYFGIFALARVFDPLDYVMYGIGVMMAVFVDRVIFSKTFSFWD